MRCRNKLSTALTVVALIVTFTAAIARDNRSPAVSADPIGDCNSSDRAKQLAGCTRLVQRGGLSDEQMAIVYSRRSDANLGSRNIDQSIADRSKAAELQPNDASFKRRLSETYVLRAMLKSHKNRSAILDDYAAAIKADPSNHAAFFARASLFLSSNDEARAINDLEAAIELAPDNRPYRTLLGKAYESQATNDLLRKDYGKAVEEYTAAIAVDPANASLFLGRGIARESSEDVGGAMKDYGEAIRLEPDREEAYLRRAQLYHGFDARSAIPDLNEVIKRNPKNPTALLLRGLAQEDNDQHEEAIADYRAVLAIEPRNNLAKANLERAMQLLSRSKLH